MEYFTPEPKISEITRRDIFDYLRVNKIRWSGRLDEPNFLSRVFDLENLPSYDSRFRGMHRDIVQHRIANHDWEDDWVFEDGRLNLMRGPDEDLLSFLCEMLHPVVRPDIEEVNTLSKDINKVLARDNFELYVKTKLSGKPVFGGREIGVTTHGLDAVEDASEPFNSDYISRQIARMKESVADDPELAIGTAKELIETCCKTIHDNLEIDYDVNWDIIRLVKETCKVLKLSPDDIPDEAKLADTIRRILGNLASVGHGMAELRNPYGSGHGKSAKSKGLEPRHARLAVGASSTLVTFLFETHNCRMEDSE